MDKFRLPRLHYLLHTDDVGATLVCTACDPTLALESHVTPIGLDEIAEDIERHQWIMHPDERWSPDAAH